MIGWVGLALGACALLIGSCGILEQLTATSEDAHKIAHDAAAVVAEARDVAVEVVLPAVVVLIGALVESVRRGRKWKRRYHEHKNGEASNENPDDGGGTDGAAGGEFMRGAEGMGPGDDG